MNTTGETMGEPVNTGRAEHEDDRELYAAQRAYAAYMAAIGLPARHAWGLLSARQQQAWVAAAYSARHPVITSPVPAQARRPSEAAGKAAAGILDRVRQRHGDRSA